MGNRRGCRGAASKRRSDFKMQLKICGQLLHSMDGGSDLIELKSQFSLLAEGLQTSVGPQRAHEFTGDASGRSEAHDNGDGAIVGAASSQEQVLSCEAESAVADDGNGVAPQQAATPSQGVVLGDATTRQEAVARRCEATGAAHRCGAVVRTRFAQGKRVRGRRGCGRRLWRREQLAAMAASRVHAHGDRRIDDTAGAASLAHDDEMFVGAASSQEGSEFLGGDANLLECRGDNHDGGLRSDGTFTWAMAMEQIKELRYRLEEAQDEGAYWQELARDREVTKAYWQERARHKQELTGDLSSTKAPPSSSWRTVATQATLGAAVQDADAVPQCGHDNAVADAAATQKSLSALSFGVYMGLLLVAAVVLRSGGRYCATVVLICCLYLAVSSNGVSMAMGALRAVPKVGGWQRLTAKRKQTVQDKWGKVLDLFVLRGAAGNEAQLSAQLSKLQQHLVQDGVAFTSKVEALEAECERLRQDLAAAPQVKVLPRKRVPRSSAAALGAGGERHSDAEEAQAVVVRRQVPKIGKWLRLSRKQERIICERWDKVADIMVQIGHSGLQKQYDKLLTAEVRKNVELSLSCAEKIKAMQDECDAKYKKLKDKFEARLEQRIAGHKHMAIQCSNTADHWTSQFIEASKMLKAAEEEKKELSEEVKFVKAKLAQVQTK